MKLPDTNAITLPDENGTTFPLDASNQDEGMLPDWDAAALARRFLPGYAQRGVDPLRDANLRAFARMANRARTDETRIMAAQQSPRFAFGPWLRAWGDEKKTPQQPGETDGAYRARLLVSSRGIAPGAVQDALRTALADLYAPQPLPVFVEPNRDFAFWRTASAGASAPHAYWQSRTSGRGLIWASGRRTGKRTAGTYWVTAPQTVGGAANVFAPKLWVLLPSSATATAHVWTAFATIVQSHKAHWSAAADTTWKDPTVWSRATTLDAFTRAVALLATRVMGGVGTRVFVEPNVKFSVIR